MDGLFEQKEHAVQFTREFTALYTNGPAGGGGIRLKSTSCRTELNENHHHHFQLKLKAYEVDSQWIRKTLRIQVTPMIKLLTPRESKVTALQDLHRALNNPIVLQRWDGNDPCEESWTGVECSGSSVIRFTPAKSDN